MKSLARPAQRRGRECCSLSASEALRLAAWQSTPGRRLGIDAVRGAFGGFPQPIESAGRSLQWAQWGRRLGRLECVVCLAGRPARELTFGRPMNWPTCDRRQTAPGGLAWGEIERPADMVGSLARSARLASLGCSRRPRGGGQENTANDSGRASSRAASETGTACKLVRRSRASGGSQATRPAAHCLAHAASMCFH